MNSLNRIILTLVLVLNALVMAAVFISYYHYPKFDFNQTKLEVETYYQRKIQLSLIQEKRIKQIFDANIIALGESSIILPGDCQQQITSGKNFIDLIQSERKLQVSNLASCGADSADVLFYLNKLDLNENKTFLFYLGHNDLTNIMRKFYIGPRLLFPMNFWRDNFDFLSMETKFKIVYFIFHTIEVPRMRLMNKLNGNYFNPQEAKQVSELVYQYFRKNIKAMKNILELKHQKYFFITPVSNLFYPPIGANQLIIDQYHLALKADDRLMLKAAAEEDFMGFDLRAKSEIIKILNEEVGQNLINIEDQFYLEKDQEKAKELFTDIFHLSLKGHQRVFERIKNYL